MEKNVSVRVEIDPSADGTEVIIKTEERAALVEDIVLAVEQCARNRHPRICVYQGDSRKVLRQQDIIRIYTENRKLMLVIVYFIIWMIQYLIYKHKVKRMNEELKKMEIHAKG